MAHQADMGFAFLLQGFGSSKGGFLELFAGGLSELAFPLTYSSGLRRWRKPTGLVAVEYFLCGQGP